jgi:glucokinase
MLGGLDLGGAKIQAAVLDDDHRPLGDARHPTPTQGGPEEIAKAMAATLAEAALSAGVDVSELDGIGACAPGEVDSERGIVANAHNLAGWGETAFPLAEYLRRRLGARVRISNDVNAATFGELRLGAGRPYGSLLGVFWGTGVGGGVVLDGRIWSGRGAAGEVGHTLVKLGGAQCSCGNHGCMEAYAGRGPMEARARAEHDKGRKTRLFKLMRERDRPRLTSGIWERALEEGDHLADELMRRAVEALGAGIGSSVNLLDVPAVIIGGGMGLRFFERYRDDITAAMRAHLFDRDQAPDLHVAQLGDLGGAIGATLLLDERV